MQDKPPGACVALVDRVVALALAPDSTFVTSIFSTPA
jgi:hypothetical protein